MTDIQNIKLNYLDSFTAPGLALHKMTLTSPEQLELARQAADRLSDEKAAELLHFLMLLSNEEAKPFVRMEAASWLAHNNYARPAAITALIELVYNNDKQVVFEALEQLAAIDDPQAIKGLQGLIKWGASQKVRQRASELFKKRQEEGPVEPQRIDVQLNGPAPVVALPAAQDAYAKAEPLLLNRTVPSAVLTAASTFSRLFGYNRSQPLRFPLLLLALTTMAELLTILPDPSYGMLLHIGIVFLLFCNLLEAHDAKVRRLYTVLLLVPLIRVLSLGLPLGALPQINWYLAPSVPLFASMILIIRQEAWEWEELGLTLNRPLLQLLIGIAGIGLGWIQYQVLNPTPIVTELTWQALWLPALILFVCTGYLEELLFRGLLQSAAISVIGRWPGLLFVAGLFAVLHIGYSSLLDLLFVFAVGLLFGLLVEKTNSLLGVTVAHGLTNITLFLIWPLLIG